MLATWAIAQVTPTSGTMPAVSKDADFSNRIMLSRPPPWIVRLRFGNMRKSAFHACVKNAWLSIEVLLPTHKLINVFANRIEGIKE